MITIGGRAHNLDEVMSLSKLGLSFIEVSLDDPVTVSGWLPQLVEIKNTCAVAFLAHYPNEDNPFDVAILRDQFLPRIKALMTLSEKLDIHKSTIHFWMDKRWAPADLIRGKLDILSRIVDYGNDYGITVCLKNLSERADSFAPAFEAIPDLRMTLDIGHAQLLAKQNTSFRFIEDHFSRIAHILGEGSVNYSEIFKTLVSKGYDSTITMEVKIKDMLKTRKTLEDCLLQT
jgi:sugar phosphate isomerase/epimerase